MTTFARDLAAPDATALLNDLRNGQTSSELLITQHLARLDSAQGALNGATQVYHEQALTQARALDSTGDKSLPLFGLPCSVKETFGIADEQVTAGSIRMTPEQHTENSAIVQCLKDAARLLLPTVISLNLQ